MWRRKERAVFAVAVTAAAAAAVPTVSDSSSSQSLCCWLAFSFQVTCSGTSYIDKNTIYSHFSSSNMQKTVLKWHYIWLSIVGAVTNR